MTNMTKWNISVFAVKLGYVEINHKTADLYTRQGNPAKCYYANSRPIFFSNILSFISRLFLCL